MRRRIRQIGTALFVWARRWWLALVVVFGIIAVLAVGVVLSLVLARQAAELLSQIAPGVSDKDRADLERNALQYQADNLTKLWTGIVQALGAVTLGIGGYIGWRNLQATKDKIDADRRANEAALAVSQRNLEETQKKIEADRLASEKNLALAQEQQITNRFTQAIGQLGTELKDGNPNLEVRLGGIYALERIARDSPRDHWTIMEVLTAYVRQNARWVPPSAPAEVASSPEDLREEPQEVQKPPKPRTDVQAILTVLGRRELSTDRRESARLDLPETDLRWAFLGGAHLEGAFLTDAHLEGAFLTDAHLEGAFLRDGHLEQADLTAAHLERAELGKVRLEGAFLGGAHLEQAFLGAAHLEQAFLRDVHLEGAPLAGAHLEQADLSDAHLEQAFLLGAYLEQADLSGAHLEQAYLRDVHLEGASLDRADLRTSEYLTEEQVKSAASRRGALLPLHLAHLEEPDEPVAESPPPPPAAPAVS